MKVKVTFVRTYEIEEKDIIERLKDSNLPKDYKFSDEEIKDEAVNIAFDYLSDEVYDFTENMQDFVGYETKIIKS